MIDIKIKRKFLKEMKKALELDVKNNANTSKEMGYSFSLCDISWVVSSTVMTDDPIERSDINNWFIKMMQKHMIGRTGYTVVYHSKETITKDSYLYLWHPHHWKCRMNYINKQIKAHAK